MCEKSAARAAELACKGAGRARRRLPGVGPRLLALRPGGEGPRCQRPYALSPGKSGESKLALTSREQRQPTPPEVQISPSPPTSRERSRRARESREIAAACAIFACSRALERRRTTLVEADLINSSPRRGEPVPFAAPEIGVPSFHCSIAPEESANDRERWPCQCAGGGNPQTQIRARELESIAC